MTDQQEPGTAVVTGASRGFGRAVADHLVRAGWRVVGIAREEAALAETARDVGFVALPGDATDAGLAAQVLRAHRPRVVVLAAGATPTMRALAEHTWESFSAAWDTDVRQTFEWTAQALRTPLDPGSVVLAFSSGAALQGSPLSGGYAGAKSTVRFVTSYAAEESARAGLGIRFTCVLPRLTPATALGAVGVAGYADRDGVDVATYLASFGPTSSADEIGTQVLRLLLDPSFDRPAYRLPPQGSPVAV